MDNTYTYRAYGRPSIETEYYDDYETVMVVSVERSDGVTGDMWVVAGVPDYLQSQVVHCGQRGLASVRVFGDNVHMWCPDALLDPDEDGRYSELAKTIADTAREMALKAHFARTVEIGGHGG